MRELVPPPRRRTGLVGKVSFTEMTIRKRQRGRHQLEVLVNGVRYSLGEFEVSR